MQTEGLAPIVPYVWISRKWVMLSCNCSFTFYISEGPRCFWICLFVPTLCFMLTVYSLLLFHSMFVQCLETDMGVDYVMLELRVYCLCGHSRVTL